MPAIKQAINIQKELSRLWNEAQGKNKTRASLFNLIIYVEKDNRVDYYQQMIKSAISKFPCRVILIINDSKSNEEYLDATVQSESFGDAKDQQIYCELIQIHVSGKSKDQVPYLVLPQILVDLPLYLLWTQDPSLNDPILAHFTNIAKRIIFDSETTTDVQSFAKNVLELIKKLNCEVGDLGWSALSGWRKIIAQVFDTQEELTALSQSKLIKISFNHDPASFLNMSIIKAAYLHGWLAAQMNWKFKNFDISEGNIHVDYQSPINVVEFLLIPAQVNGLREGEIVGIEIESELQNGLYVVKRAASGRQVFIQYSNKNQCDLPYCVYLPGMKSGEEIIEEIFYPKTGEHYRNMLECLSKIPWRSRT